jgi:hypothetical protein
MIFLDTTVVSPIVAAGGFAFLFALLAAFAIIAFVIAVALYVYVSFAFMAIAKKVKYSTPGIAWIPVVGPALIASNTAEMHWWPILLLIGFFIPYLSIICWIVFAVFFVIWMWKTFEAVSKPGWWAIFAIIPLLNIVFLIFLGIAAWGKK